MPIKTQLLCLKSLQKGYPLEIALDLDVLAEQLVDHSKCTEKELVGWVLWCKVHNSNS